MKIFISYGHNDHVNLVNAVFDALIEAGHEPWKDDRYEGVSGIAPGKDFVEVIYDAIDESDFVVAFVSESTQKKPFCCDERQYAYNKKGDRFIQIRLDGTDIRLGNSRSYIDMSDVEESNGKISVNLFKEKMRFLFAAFRDPASFAEGGFTPWAKFEAHLKVPGVMKYAEFISMPDKEDFIGREWLCEKCRSWVMDDSIPCRLFVILGEAGTGKTAFVRHLASDRELVRSVHICIYDRPSTRTAKDTLKDLAYILAGNNDSYFNYLKNKSFDKIEDMSIDGMFEFLFLEPLKNETEKYLLIIDGLDELDEANGLKPLMMLFRQFAERINPNISFLVTGRPDDNITDKLRTVRNGRPLEKVVLDSESGRDDLKEYITFKLKELGCFSEVLRDRLLEGCDGNFEYLALLFREAGEEGLVLTENMKMPRGLYERYTQYIDRRMESQGLNLRFTKLQRKLLSVMCVAYEPMPLSLLADIINADEGGFDEYDAEDELNVFGSLIRKSRDRGGEIYVSFFAKGFRDYLLEKAFSSYSADFNQGTKLISGYILENCRSQKSFEKNPYINRNGFRHLFVHSERESAAVEAFSEGLWKENGDFTSLKIAEALSMGDEKTARAFFEMYEDNYEKYRDVIKQLKRRREKDTLNVIVSVLDALGFVAKALILRADILLMEPSPETKKEAEGLLLQALEIREREYKDKPCYEARENLSVVYDRLVIGEMEKNTPEGIARAEKWCEKLLQLDEQNYKENPCYESRHGLAIAYERLGGIAQARSTPEGMSEAEEWYKKGCELLEQNYKENPCYESQRSLAVTYDKLGGIAKARSTPEGMSEAEEWYKKGCELKEQNYKENPCYESRRSLAIAYERLGGIAQARSTPEGMAEAEAWYKKECELDEQNYKENPCYESRRSLAVTYERLGDISKARSTPEGMAEAEEWYKKECELLEQNYKENPCYESRRSLAVPYYRLAQTAEAKNTEEGKKEAEEWYKKECELDEQNYKENPCYESRRSLAITYDKLGGIAQARSTPEGMSEAEEWYKKGCELDEQNYKENPCYESRRSLAIAYERLGGIAQARSTPEGMAEAEEWYKKECELLEQNYKENPCYESRRSLAVPYYRLAQTAEAKNTEEGKKEAAHYYSKAFSLLS